MPKAKIFTFLTTAFLGGILLASIPDITEPLAWPLVFLIISLTLFLSFVYLILRLSQFILPVFCFLLAFCGFVYFTHFSQNTFADWPFGQEAMIEGIVSNRPEASGGKQSLLFKVERLSLNNAAVEFDNKLLLVFVSPYDQFQYGEKLVIRAEISRPGKIGEFDYQKYLKKYPVYGLVIKPNEVTKVEVRTSIRSKIYRSLYSFSDRLERSLERSLPEPHASLAIGIILGQKRSMPEELQDDLNKTGLSHLTALSGFNITIITQYLGGILAFWFGRKRSFAIGSAIVILFVVLTGAAASIIRAAIFSLLLLFGQTIGRQADKWNLLLLAAVLMVLNNPFVLYYDMGFQLSFLAFIGLILFASTFRKRFETIGPAFLSFWRGNLSETLAAQVLTLPLLLVSFGQLSLISPFANVFVLSFIPLSMGISFATSILGAVYLPLGRLSSYLLWPLLEYIIQVVKLCARLPFSAIKLDQNTLAATLTFYFLFNLLILLRIVERRRRLGALQK